MIDPAHGTISREIFVSPEFTATELEKLFTRAWLFVGHESQIPNPGDFFVSRMGEESVIRVPRPDGCGACVPEFLPTSRDEGLPLRTGEYVAVCLPVSFVELHDGRQAARRAAVSCAVRGHAEPRGVVADRGRETGALQRHGVGHVGSAGARFPTYLGDAVDTWTMCSIAATAGPGASR